MADKRVQGLKTRKKHSLPAFFMFLFSLISVAAVVLNILPSFVPALRFLDIFGMDVSAASYTGTDGSGVIISAASASFDGTDFFLSVFHLLRSFGVDVLDKIAAPFGGASSLDFIDTLTENIRQTALVSTGFTKFLLGLLPTVLPYVFALIGLFLLIAAVLALILFLKALIRFLFEPKKPENWRGTVTLAKGISVLLFIACLLSAAVMYGLQFVFNALAKAAGGSDICTLTLKPVIAIAILFGSALLSRIVLGILYSKCFKDHVYLRKGGNAAEPPVEEPAAPVMNDPSLQGKTIIRATIQYEASACLPKGTKEIGDHAFSKRTQLMNAEIPEGIPSLGIGAFANCPNLRSCTIPKSVTVISANCFFNCQNLTEIVYRGNKYEWSQIKRGSNWLSKAGTSNVMCSDGEIIVNPYN